ncbi:unnamed protein product, partial [Amoebophrya sp. A25]
RTEVQAASRSTNTDDVANTLRPCPVLTIDRATRGIAHRVRQTRSQPLLARSAILCIFLRCDPPVLCCRTPGDITRVTPLQNILPLYLLAPTT